MNDAANQSTIRDTVPGTISASRQPAGERHERRTLGIVAAGRSNAAIARLLVLNEKTVETHISSILTKLDLLQTPDDHRRVLAVRAWPEV